jgi:transcription elongation factor GreA
MMAEMLQLQFRLEPEDGQLTNDQPLSISQAINQFVDHLKESKQALQGQQELLRFQARIGRDKPMSTLHAIEVGEYAKWTTENVEDPSTRLDPVKKFLTFANRRGWTENSLARYAAAPRRNRRRFQNTGQNGTYTGTPSARLSQERHTELQVELQRLRDEVPQIREAIRLARSDGDVRENAPLDAAREQQQLVERRIRQLENDLANVEIVDAFSASTERVAIGSRVTLHDLASQQQRVFTLVDVREADVSAGKISTVSPIGEALMGRSPGEEVTINTPRGSVQYRIEGIGG